MKLSTKITLALMLGIHLTGYAQWQPKNISTNRVLSSVDFLDNETGFVTGGNMIFKTVNGGDNWMTSHTASANEFVTFPNPASEIVHVQSKNNNAIESVRIFDVNGKLLRELQPNAPNAEIDFSGFESNVYYLEIQSDKLKRVQKIVKK